MATRKQRSRRAKTFRHEYGFVKVDEDGNEVEVARDEIRPKKDPPAKAKASGAGKSKSKTSRPVREPQPASWSRALRRSAIWAGPVILASVLILHGQSLPLRIAFGAGYAALFLPMTYWMDGLIYRRYERRKTAGPPSRSSRSR
jgi:hypothetical protein